MVRREQTSDGDTSDDENDEARARARDVSLALGTNIEPSTHGTETSSGQTQLDVDGPNLAAPSAVGASAERTPTPPTHPNPPFPSLLSPSFRPMRKALIIQREDGYEKRRIWRCGRCALVIGYELLSERIDDGDRGDGGDASIATEGEGAGYKESERVIFLLEDGLVETQQLAHPGVA